jgi:hypothetical protein
VICARFHFLSRSVNVCALDANALHPAFRIPAIDPEARLLPLHPRSGRDVIVQPQRALLALQFCPSHGVQPSPAEKMEYNILGMRFTHFLFAQFLNRRFSRIEDSSRRWRWVWEPEQWFGCAIVIIARNGRLQYFAWTRNWTWIIGGTTFFYL